MPEANIPAMNRKADGASSIPPEMAKPLVQPPAIPAAYSRIIAPTNASSQRFQTCGPKTLFHWVSLLAESFLPHLSVPLVAVIRDGTGGFTWLFGILAAVAVLAAVVAFRLPRESAADPVPAAGD